MNSICMTAALAGVAGAVGERREMMRRFVHLSVALAALALGTASVALADNDATGSVGTVQVGGVSVDPSVE
jgi:hypothetical protein